jgi:uncharacterized protein YqeY
MVTKGELEAELHRAMRSGDETRKRTLRMILSSVKLAEVEKRGELDDAGMQAVLQKEARVRHEAIADAEKAQRADLADAGRAELAIVQSYLPEALSAEELERIAREATAAGATDPRTWEGHEGTHAQVQGRADGKTVNAVVRGLLTPLGSLMEEPSTGRGRFRSAWAGFQSAAVGGGAGRSASSSPSLPYRLAPDPCHSNRRSLGRPAGAPPWLYTSDVLTRWHGEPPPRGRGSLRPPTAGWREQLSQLRTLLAYVDAVRGDTHGTDEQRLADLAAIGRVQIDTLSAGNLLSLPAARWEAVRVEATTVLEQLMRSEIHEGDLNDVRRSLPALVSVTLPEDQAALAARLASAFVAPNAFFNQVATDEARRLASTEVTPVVKSYAAGETIVNHGEVVEEAHLEALRAFGLLRPPDAWRQAAVNALLATVLATTLALYVYRVHPHLAVSSRLALLLGVSFVVAALTMQLMIPGRTVLPYLFPAGTLPMVVAVIFGPGMGVLVAFLTGSLAGFLGARGLELGLYISLSGAISALVIGKAERLVSFFWAGSPAVWRR